MPEKSTKGQSIDDLSEWPTHQFIEDFHTQNCDPSTWLRMVSEVQGSGQPILIPVDEDEAEFADRLCRTLVTRSGTLGTLRVEACASTRGED